ncbi:hypothetical protein (nucleomorph) [Guillardia theta]|uniref:Uncharacterized protein n=1 Tax=Guillardia theta TaxID=55529 RepID=Q98S98_GUITH|nr:hypothetical protein GTHECHR3041 [Guillardia theta]AAK39685.1 hypothetical protein [Guillardia theta]
MKHFKNNFHIYTKIGPKKKNKKLIDYKMENLTYKSICELTNLFGFLKKRTDHEFIFFSKSIFSNCSIISNPSTYQTMFMIKTFEKILNIKFTASKNLIFLIRYNKNFLVNIFFVKITNKFNDFTRFKTTFQSFENKIILNKW